MENGIKSDNMLQLSVLNLGVTKSFRTRCLANSVPARVGPEYTRGGVSVRQSIYITRTHFNFSTMSSS